MKMPLLVLGVFLLAAGCKSPPPEEAPPRAVRVRSVEARADGRAFRYSGTLEAKAQVELAFRVPGRVSLVSSVQDGKGRRLLQEGDEVKAGQVLAALDLGDLRRQASSAAAAMATAAAQVQAARVGLSQAEREVTRARRLAQNGDLPQADLDRAETAVTSARANLEAAEGNHQARIEQHALARSALSDATLKSPIDGVVARRAVDPGENIAPNLPVLSIIDRSYLKLVFGLPDTRLGTIRVGEAIPVRVEALPERSFEGRVTKVSPTADPALRTFAVELELAPLPELRPGMTATALLGGQQEHAQVVPLAAIVRSPKGKGYAVFTLEADGRTVAQREIQVADLLENEAILEGALEPSAPVVVEGAAFLRPGDKVEVIQ